MYMNFSIINNDFKMNAKHFLKQIYTILVVLILVLGGDKQNKLIYILEWTVSKESWIYLDLEMGQEAFIKRNCTFFNCFLTDNRSLFRSILDFDVLLFNAVHVGRGFTEVPSKRSEVQQYVFVGIEPAAYYTLSTKYNFFFNITWTYKLTSDVVQPYIVVKNIQGEKIGPQKNMHWVHSVKDMARIGNTIKSKLQQKTIAAAWIVSNCDAMSGRQKFVKKLQKELNKYNHRVDIYGKCGNLDCEKINGEKNGLISACSSKIDSDYYFYLAFENSFGEDYVTEKLLHALNRFAVPVVYGGANYSRFMPEGIYLNARQLGPEGLAKTMSEIIVDRKRFYNFFTWHNYYSFHNTDEFLQRDGICDFCALLNNKTRRDQRIVHRIITKFWNVLPPPYEYDESESSTTEAVWS